MSIWLCYDLLLMVRLGARGTALFGCRAFVCREGRSKAAACVLALGLGGGQGCSPVARVHSSATSPARRVEVRPQRCSLRVESEAVPASRLTQEEILLLLGGARVEEPTAFELCGEHYVGGLGYVLVRATPREVFDSLNQLKNLSRVIRGTRTMTVVDVGQEGTQVLMEQGNSIVSARYTATFQADVASDLQRDWTVRFWLDGRRPHAIEDVWGRISAATFDESRTLVTIGTVVNLGPGLIRMLFEGHLQRSILRMPRYVRQVVEAKHYVAPELSQ